MEKTYNCKTCSYNTKNISNYKRHMCSQRHISNSKKIESFDTCKSKCEYCNEIFSRQDSLKRHKKTCYTGVIKQKEEIIKNNFEHIKSQEEELLKKNDEIKYYRHLLELNGKKEFSYDLVSNNLVSNNLVSNNLVSNKFNQLKKLMY